MFTSGVLQHRLRRVRFLLLVVATLLGVFYWSFLNESYELNHAMDEEALPPVTDGKEGQLLKTQMDNIELSDWSKVVEKNAYFPLLADAKGGTKVDLRLPEDYFDNQKSTQIRKHKRKLLYDVGKENYRKFPRVGKSSNYPPIQLTTFKDGGKKVPEKLEKIKAAFLKSWKVYKDYGYGHDEVTPLSHKALDPFNGWSATLVDSLDTLWLMGLDAELKEGIDFINKKVNFAQSHRHVIPVFENTIRILGGLLTAYDLTEDKQILKSCVEIGDLLMEAFDTPNHMPLLFYDYMTDTPNRITPKYAALSEIGTLSLEFSRLTQLTGNNRYYDAVDRITDKFRKSRDNFIIKGLYANIVDTSGCRILSKKEIDAGVHLNNKNVHKIIRDGKYAYCEYVDYIKSLHGQEDYSLGGLSDSFYEYLPKMYHLLRGNALHGEVYKEMYLEAYDQMKNFMFFKPKIPGGEKLLLSTRLSAWETKEFIELTPSNDVEHLSCFAGGMVGLGARLFDMEEDMSIAEKLTMGCVHMYELMGIMPEVFECDRWEEGEPLYDEAERLKEITGENMPEKPSDNPLEHGDKPQNNMTPEEKEALRKKLEQVMADEAQKDKEFEAAAVEGGKKDKREVIAKETVVNTGKPINFNIVKHAHFQPFTTMSDGTRRWPVAPTWNQPLYLNEMYPSYILRPEAIESVFYMYRLTGDPKWREYGWMMWENVEKYAQKDGMFTAVKDITRPMNDPQRYEDSLESFWFAETLKYFYLLFEDVNVFSLDEWVFNTEAHPFKLVQ